MRFLAIARASLIEVRYLALLCQDLGYWQADVYLTIDQDLDDVASMISKMGAAVRKTIREQRADPAGPKKRKAESGKPPKEVPPHE